MVRHIDAIEPMLTSHGAGLKKLLLNKDEILDPVTQMAYTTLVCGTLVEKHVHPSMDEYFFVIEGKITFAIAQEIIVCEKGSFVRIVAGDIHSLQVDQDAVVFTIGIAIKTIE